MDEENNFVVKFVICENNDISKLKVPTNFVPAVAVIRRGRVLLLRTGRKGHLGCLWGGNENLNCKFKKILQTNKLWVK